jgi:hypothetical protein
MNHRFLLAVLLVGGLVPMAVAADSKSDDKTKLPEAMDLCKYQTPFRNQGGRDTCPYFPPIAALEAAYGRTGVKVDLSVEHLIWLRNVTAGSDKNASGVAEDLSCMVGGGNGMGILRQFAVCRAQDMPYHGENIQTTPFGKAMGVECYDWGKPFSQFVLDRWNFDPHVLPPQARAHARYGIESYKSIAPQDLQDPRKYEEVLADGREIVFSINIHDNAPGPKPGELPVWHFNPDSKAGTVNHFMLIVGYNRPHKFFVVKNQWGSVHYAANPKALAPGWKDALKYEGYTLVGYDYLATCSEAHYITEVAPVGSPRFTSQRALGEWKVTFQHKDAKLLTGVLCWRKLPLAAAGSNKADLRIGDLYTADHQQYRVNAELDGDGTKPYEVKLYVDFVKGVLPTDSTSGAAWSGTLTLPESGKSILSLKSAGGERQKIKDVDVEDVVMTAELGRDTNLLKAMPEPK